MPKPLEIHLTEIQRLELEQARDHDPHPQVREHAAAILKIAEGMSGRQVALQGLYKHRWPDSVYRWVKRYQAEGLKGLRVRGGRGRKPAFSPKIRG